MDQRLGGKQRAAFPQLLEDRAVGFFIVQAFKLAGFFRHIPAVVHGHHRAELRLSRRVVCPADNEVLHAVSGRRMHAAGAGVERHMVADQNHGVPVKERVRGGHQFKLPPGSLARIS